MPTLSGSKNPTETEVKNSKKNQTFVWQQEAEFRTREEAMNHIKDQNMWSAIKKHETKTAIKEYFRCNIVKRRGKCPAQRYLACLGTNGEFPFVFFTITLQIF